MNTCTFIGNLTSEPVMRYTGDGKPVTSFSIAINNGKTKTGEDRPPTYVDIVAWEKLAELCAEYLRKGRKCAVVGQLTFEDWEKDGVKHRSTKIRAREVEFLSPRDDNQAPLSTGTPQRTASRSERDELDDLPF